MKDFTIELRSQFRRQFLEQLWGVPGLEYPEMGIRNRLRNQLRELEWPLSDQLEEDWDYG